METDLVGGRHINPSSGREPFEMFAVRWRPYSPGANSRVFDSYHLRMTSFARAKTEIVAHPRMQHLRNGLRIIQVDGLASAAMV